MVNITCTSVFHGDKPEWNFNTARERLKRHPPPKIQIIYNDSMLGFLYNNGKRMSNSEFMNYVEEYIKKNKKDCEVDFIDGIDLSQRKVIRMAILHFDKGQK